MNVINIFLEKVTFTHLNYHKIQILTFNYVIRDITFNYVEIDLRVPTRKLLSKKEVVTKIPL